MAGKNTLNLSGRLAHSPSATEPDQGCRESSDVLERTRDVRRQAAQLPLPGMYTLRIMGMGHASVKVRVGPQFVGSTGVRHYICRSGVRRSPGCGKSMVVVVARCLSSEVAAE